jgi:hypothetical protein
MIKVISTRDREQLDRELKAIETYNAITNIAISTTTVPMIGLCRDWTYVDVLYTAVVTYHSTESKKKLLAD